MITSSNLFINFFKLKEYDCNVICTSVYMKNTFANDLKEKIDPFSTMTFLFPSSSTLPPSSRDNYQLNIFNKTKPDQD